MPDKKTQVKADSKADSEDSTGISSDVSDSANDSSADASSTDTASAPDAEAEPTSEPEAADDTSNTENTDNTAVSFDADNVPEVSTVLEQYYTALGARNINGLFAVTDNLTAEEQAQIEAESDVESYGDVKAYTISVQATERTSRLSAADANIWESTRPCRCFRSIISTRQKTAA